MTTTERRSLLFVDDEEAILNGLRHALHAERHRWDMRFAKGGAAALEMLYERPAEVVVTDMRMPQMDGLALLKCVKEGWPLSTRIVLSGFADLALVAQASSVAHQYLLKPCDSDVLRGVLDHALLLQSVLASDTLREIVGSLGSLPTAPQVYQALTIALADPDVEIKKLARIVEQDVGVSTRVLQFVNSAYYGLTRRVTSIDEAIVFVGIGTLRHLALSLEVFKSFGGPRTPGASFEALERHALLTARIARGILGDPSRAEAAFAAGLLHDCGKLVLMNRLPDQWENAAARAAGDGRAAVAVERELLGASHAEVGAYLLGLWGLPHAIVEAVAFHHSDERIASGNLDITAVVGIANLLARRALTDPGVSPDAEGTFLGRLEEGLGAAGWRRIAEAEAHRMGGAEARP